MRATTSHVQKCVDHADRLQCDRNVMGMLDYGVSVVGGCVGVLSEEMMH